jgi:hypothetical protein
MNDKPPIAEAKTKPTARATAAAKPDPNLSILIGGPPEQSQIPIAHNTQVTGIAQQFVAWTVLQFQIKGWFLVKIVLPEKYSQPVRV